MSDLSAAAADYQPADMDARERERQWGAWAMEAQARAIADAQNSGFSSMYRSPLYASNAPAPPPKPPADPQGSIKGRTGIFGTGGVAEVVWHAQQAGHAVTIEYGPGWLSKPFIIRGPVSALRPIWAWLKKAEQGEARA